MSTTVVTFSFALVALGIFLINQNGTTQLQTVSAASTIKPNQMIVPHTARAINVAVPPKPKSDIAMHHPEPKSSNPTSTMAHGHPLSGMAIWGLVVSLAMFGTWMFRQLSPAFTPKSSEECIALASVTSEVPAIERNILIFGPNGSGKGTQGALIVKQFLGMAHIESGAIFRQHIGSGSKLGQIAKEYIDRGELVPDEITIPMVLETMKERGAQGWLLDGFPRNMVQAEKLWEALQAENIKLDYVVEILLPRPIAKGRIMGRRLCVNDPNHPNNVEIPAIAPSGDSCRVCGGTLSSRADDQDEDAINKRHDIYYNADNGTLAAVSYYQRLADDGKLKFIQLDGAGSITEVKEALLKGLNE